MWLSYHVPCFYINRGSIGRFKRISGIRLFFLSFAYVTDGDAVCAVIGVECECRCERSKDKTLGRTNPVVTGYGTGACCCLEIDRKGNRL